MRGRPLLVRLLFPLWLLGRGRLYVCAHVCVSCVRGWSTKYHSARSRGSLINCVWCFLCIPLSLTLSLSLAVQINSLVYARVVVAHKDMEPELACMSASNKADGFGELRDGYVFECSLGLAKSYVLCAAMRQTTNPIMRWQYWGLRLVKSLIPTY